MKTWSDVQAFATKHSLPYKVQRFNMSLAGVLVDVDTDCAVAYTVKESADFLTRYAKTYTSICLCGAPLSKNGKCSVNDCVCQ